MAMLKRDTTPLAKEDLIKLKYDLDPYDCRLEESDGQKVFVVRSPKASPDLINDLEPMIDRICEEDVKEAQSACLLGEEESATISMSILWSLIDKRKKRDTKLVTELRGKISRDFGHLLFRSEEDPLHIYRLAIYVPMPISNVDKDNFEEMFEELDLPREGEIVYLIADDGYKRISGREFFTILDGSPPEFGGGGSVPAAEQSEGDIGEDYMPKVTRGMTPGTGGVSEGGEVDEDEFMPKITKGMSQYKGTEPVEMNEEVGEEEEPEEEESGVEQLIKDIEDVFGEIDIEEEEGEETPMEERTEFMQKEGETEGGFQQGKGEGAIVQTEIDEETEGEGAMEEMEVWGEGQAMEEMVGEEEIGEEGKEIGGGPGEEQIMEDVREEEARQEGKDIGGGPGKEQIMEDVREEEARQEGKEIGGETGEEQIMEDVREEEARQEEQVMEEMEMVEEETSVMEQDRGEDFEGGKVTEGEFGEEAGEKWEKAVVKGPKPPLGEDEQTFFDESRPEKSGVDKVKEDVKHAFIRAGGIVEEKPGIVGVDFFVQHQPRPEEREYLYVTAYRKIWTELHARKLWDQMEAYNADWCILVGDEFPIDLRLFVVGRPLSLLDTKIALLGNFNLPELVS